MSFLIENWILIITLAVLLVIGVLKAKGWITLINGERMKKVKVWLLWAVTEAEAKLGGGTGRLKLSLVYESFVEKFPWLSKVITFDTFSKLVDSVLDEMRGLLTSNPEVKEIVNETVKKG